MKRAVLMFDGPPRGQRYCEGCPLYPAAEKAGDTCPIWGTLYRETRKPHDGLLCREDACIDNECAVADEEKRGSVYADLEKGP